MKTMKIIAIIAIAVFLTNCNHNRSTKENQANIAVEAKQEAATVTTIYGTYEGSIPAPNTAGIFMHLTINSDDTFVLTREYQGGRQGVFKDQGKYIIVNENVIELTDKKGIKTYYRIQDGSVILSDPEGKIADEDFASKYQLKKI